MSWNEYNDLYKIAQTTGKYHLFVFDIQNSRIGYDPLQLRKIREAMFSKLKELEVTLNKKILHLPYEKERGGYREGRLGDMFSIVIYRESLSKEEVYKIFSEDKEKLNIPYNFHFDDCFYETDNWILGDQLYYREYGIQFLEDRARTKKDTI